ncbi:MAG: hypothetical protein F6J93_12745 [Oscillatoria sp. SIO1A7]|nr:hypothetical protein [Oscillatoria sp. SIO1A7]
MPFGQGLGFDGIFVGAIRESPLPQMNISGCRAGPPCSLSAVRAIARTVVRSSATTVRAIVLSPNGSSPSK